MDAGAPPGASARFFTTCVTLTFAPAASATGGAVTRRHGQIRLHDLDQRDRQDVVRLVGLEHLTGRAPRASARTIRK